jgi:hypothetical protein
MAMIRRGRSLFILYLVTCAYTIFSLVLLQAYQLGDRKVYANLYYTLPQYDFFGGIKLYFLTLGSVDIGWYLVYFYLSRVFEDFNIAQATVSVILLWQCGRFFINRSSNLKLYLLYINFFINIQFLALSYSSLRLAVAFLFFLIASNMDRVNKFVFSVAAVFSHVTIIIIIYLNRAKELAIMNNIYYRVFGITSFLFLWIVAGDVIFGKINSYALSIGMDQRINGIIRYIVLISVLYIGTSQKNFGFTILTLLVFLLVPDPRVYQLVYFAVFFRLMVHRSKNACFALLLLSLLGVPSGIDYVVGVFERGNGLDPKNFM